MKLAPPASPSRGCLGFAMGIHQDPWQEEVSPYNLVDVQRDELKQI